MLEMERKFSLESALIKILLLDKRLKDLLSAGSTIVSLGTTSIFFVGNSDGTNVINGIGNILLLKLGDTVTESATETGFGTITAIGVGSIVVDNNVPIGIGSTYFIDRVGLMFR